MKKSLVLALALAAPVLAGDGKGAPVPASESIVAPAAAPAAFSLEIGTSYYEMKDENGEKVDWDGLDITGVYHITPNWSITLRGACGISENSNTLSEGSRSMHIDEDYSDWYIAPGIRYSVGLTETVTWYIGANIGYGKSRIEATWQGYMNGTPVPGASETIKESTRTWNYSAETGVQWHCTESVYIYCALQYCILKPSSSDFMDQKGSGAKIGVGFDF